MKLRLLDLHTHEEETDREHKVDEARWWNVD